MTNIPKIFDCDIHNTFKHQSQLYPYISEPHLSRLKSGGFGYPQLTYYPSMESRAKRKDSYPPDGYTAGSNVEFMVEQHFDPNNITYGVLTGGGIYGLSLMPDADFPSVIARAANDWLIDEWLSQDERFLGAIQVAIQDPETAAKEIRRVGKHPKMVMVFLPVVTQLRLSHPFYKPVLKAIADMNLVLTLHVRQPSATAPNVTPMGPVNSYYDWHVLAGLPYMSQLVTLLSSGVFEEYPDIKILMLEGGFSWLPHYLWRLDSHYKFLRSEVPWLKKLPSEYILENVRFGTQPLEEPPKQEYLLQMIEMINGYDTLVYASDYPHWDYDLPSTITKHLKEEWKENIMFNNASKLFGIK